MVSLIFISSVGKKSSLPKGTKELEIRSVRAEGASLSKSILDEVNKSKGDTILFVNGDALNDTSLITAISEAIDTSSDVTIFPVSFNEETIELLENTPEGLLKTITGSPSFPALAVALKRSLIEDSLPEVSTPSELIGFLVARGIGNFESAASAEITIPASRDGASLTMSARVTALKELVNASHIEDLFPNHAWSTHEKESAAASYHTLAAIFIKLGSLEAAQECLRLGDQLEDSPRSLALKGLIAMNRGEVLGAVANMVSSLQQYEQRKKDNSKHYSRFAPNNLETINQNLNAGLEALNKRNNEEALTFFTKAVFQFDPFYQDTGIDTNKAH